MPARRIRSLRPCAGGFLLEKALQFAADSCILGGAAGRPAAPAAQKRTRRGIEVVITGAPRKRFGSNPTWVRIPPSPPKQRAHAAHGPSALLLDRWDSKGGTENAAVRHFPAPGSDGPQLCSLEGKQQEASAENPTLCFAFGQVGFEGRNRKCRSAAFSRPGENGQETAPRGAQAGRRPCGESHPLRHVKTSLLIKKWRGENPCLQGFSPFLCSFSGSGSAFDALPVYSFTPCLYTEYLDLHPMHPRR